MPLSSRRHSGEAVENFFDNLFPDSQPIRNRIQARFGARTNRSFDLLWRIGRGALQLSPDDASMDVRRVDAEPLTQTQIAETLRNYRTMPLGMGADTEFRISMAGDGLERKRQERVALILHRHWLRTARTCRFPAEEMETLIGDLLDRMDGVIETVREQLPPSFPVKGQRY